MLSRKAVAFSVMAQMIWVTLPFHLGTFCSSRSRLEFFLIYKLDDNQRAAAIDRLNAFMRSGHAQTRIAHALPLDEIASAHELVETGQANGNVVLTIGS